VQPNEVRFQPALSRGRPCTLEVVVDIEPFAAASISVQYEKSLILFTEYPPDAQRGFSIG
jgi:phosphatidylinositol glycan class T